jgi:uncharacterized protein YqeY
LQKRKTNKKQLKTMELKQQLTADMKSAMKAKDKDTLKAVRSIIGAVKQFEIDNQKDADDAVVLQVIQKMVKQRKDSITQFKEAERDDLIAVEESELAVIAKYMPEQLSADEVEQIVVATMGEVGASSMADMGKMMGALKQKLDGKADMGEVNKILKSKLG